MAKAKSANSAQASEQVKLVLRWIVKYRFWLILGLSALLPTIGYVVGSGPIQKATADEVGKIKGADSGVAPYTAPGVVNDQWKPLVDDKKGVLTQDVNKAWEKLYARQAPLLKWPDLVEQRFHEWGRKWPENVDLGAVQKAISDYVDSYEKAVDETYKKVRPWDYVEGTGIVVVPDKLTLLRPSVFDPANPPSLSKVWSAQERLWIQGTLLDAVAQINGKAKGWDDAVVKQINALEVGSPLAQDQKSLVEGKTVKIADEIIPPGGTPTAAAADADAGAAGGPGGEAALRGMMPGMPGMGGMAAQVTDDVYHLDVPSDQYTILPVSMTVLVDQNRLPEFLVGLENSPMAIQVLEFEMLKPVNPVVKPVKGDPATLNMGMMMPGGMGMPGDPSRMMMMRGGRGEMGGMNMPGPGMMPGMYGPMMGRGDMGGASTKKGTDVRSENKRKEREEREKKRKALGRAIDTYYDIVEVTIYGQARFYNPPPAPPPAEAAVASPGEAAPDAAKADEAKKDGPKADEAKKEEAKPAEAPAKPEAPKAEAPKVEPAKPADAPAPSKPAEAPKR